MVSDGELVVDGYHLASLIAQGNHSDVWEVRDPAGAQLAMKLLKSDAMKDREQLQTLKHEARVSKLLEHPNFVKFHKSAFTKQHAYLLMEYFRAPNVKTQLMADRTGLHVRFKKLVEHLCLVLQFMHDKGWVHRDLKPDNVLINKASELRLIDFSLATRSSGGLAALFGGGKAKVIQGTRTYIAPETIRKKPATPQTDMYSLGVTLFEVLTGRPPFKAPSPDELLKQHLKLKPPAPSEFYANVSPEMDRLILRMLEKKPANRPKTMNEIYAEFRALKPFVEDPQELYDREDAVRRERELDGLRSADAVLNSRADAERQAAGIAPPPRKGKAQKIQAGQIYRDGQPVAAPVVAEQPPPVEQPMPGYPQPPYPYPPGPGYPQPQFAWPGPWAQPPWPGYGAPPPPPGVPPYAMPPGAEPSQPPAQPAPPGPAPDRAPAPAGGASRPPAPAEPAVGGTRPAADAPARSAPKAASAAAGDTGMVLTFAPEPARPAAARPAPAGGAAKAAGRAGQPAAKGQAEPSDKKSSPATATAKGQQPEGEQTDDDLPFMEELPEVV